MSFWNVLKLVTKELGYALVSISLTLLLAAGMMFAVALFERIADASEVRTKIAVLDTGVNVTNQLKPYLCEGKHYDLTGTGLKDRIGHGTNIVNIIARYLDPKRECIMMIKWYDPKFETNDAANIKHLSEAAVAAIHIVHASFINISAGGSAPVSAERKALEAALERGTVIAVAAGNSAAAVAARPPPNLHPFHQPRSHRLKCQQPIPKCRRQRGILCCLKKTVQCA